MSVPSTLARINLCPTAKSHSYIIPAARTEETEAQHTELQLVGPEAQHTELALVASRIEVELVLVEQRIELEQQVPRTELVLVLFGTWAPAQLLSAREPAVEPYKLVVRPPAVVLVQPLQAQQVSFSSPFFFFSLCRTNPARKATQPPLGYKCKEEEARAAMPT